MSMFDPYMESTISFETDYITYELSAGFDFKKDAYYMPSLAFIKNKGHRSDEVSLAFWDNEAYLIKMFYEKVLIPWNEREEIIEPQGVEDFLKIEGTSLKHFPKLEEIIKIGIKKGFFYEYYNRN